MTDPRPVPDLAAFVRELCAATGLDPAAVEVADLLDLAKEAAHGVARPAAPLTTYVAGLLVGQALAAGEGPPARVLATVLDRLRDLLPPSPAAG